MNLIIAIPSKGRLRKQALEIFSKVGYTVELPSDNRGYQGVITGYDGVEIVFLSALEITYELARGNVHLGIAGEDLAYENIANINTKMEIILPLKFGHADVVVAVPEIWIDVVNMADLDDVAEVFRQHYGRRLRIATKYWNLTQRFFADHGIAVYRIVESLGATEGAPATGLADVIVDITSTGATLRANHLKVLDDGIILRSQASLISSKTAKWTEKTTIINRKLCNAIADFLNKLDG